MPITARPKADYSLPQAGVEAAERVMTELPSDLRQNYLLHQRMCPRFFRRDLGRTKESNSEVDETRSRANDIEFAWCTLQGVDSQEYLKIFRPIGCLVIYCM